MKFQIPEDRLNQLNKDEVIEMAMHAFQWKELKCLSWYKLQTPHLGGNSPMELVQRGATARIVEYLNQKAQERKGQEF